MTWILIKGLPPELFGIDLEKWEKEKTTKIWSRKRIPKNALEEFLKYGARIIEEQEKFVLLEEPSIKEDTAHKLFRLIEIRNTVDELILETFMKNSPITRGHISNYRSYYSRKRKEKYSGYKIFYEEGKKTFKPVEEIKEFGSQSIIFLIQLYTPLEGILTISYEREKNSNNYVLKESVVARKYKGILDTKKIIKEFKLPSSFRIDEKRIIEELYE